MKTCAKCGGEKPAGDFHRNKRNKDGLQERCKACRREAWASPEGQAKRADYYSRNRDEILAKASVYYQRPDVKERKKQNDAIWYQENRERKLQYAESWRNANPGYFEEWRRENKDLKDEYYRSNPHVWWESGYRKRCLSYGLTPSVKSFTEAELVERYGDVCVDCGDDWTDVDHVLPVRFGGAHSIDNCQPVCRPCNKARWFRYQSEAYDLMANIYTGETA